jgi:hypothetical protein
MIFSQNGQFYTAILETSSFWDEMKETETDRRLDDLIRRIRDDLSDRVRMLVS